jgi:hypothetical protein
MFSATVFIANLSKHSDTYLNDYFTGISLFTNLSVQTIAFFPGEPAPQEPSNFANGPPELAVLFLIPQLARILS